MTVESLQLVSLLDKHIVSVVPFQGISSKNEALKFKKSYSTSSGKLLNLAQCLTIGKS